MYVKRGLHTILQPRGAGVRFLEVVVALVIKEFEQRRPKLTSLERRKVNSRTHLVSPQSVILIFLKSLLKMVGHG